MNIKAIIYITIALIFIAVGLFSTSEVNAMPKGINSHNYMTYEKPNVDPRYGYNKGECNTEYLAGEEYFYNEYYDHWNVDEVYDSNLVTNRNLAVAYAKANYPKCKIRFITLNKKGWKKILHRKGKGIVYIEKCTTISNGKGGGFTKKGHYYVAYNKKVKKGKKVTSYFVYNPYTNYCDDVVAAVDNKMIR